ncbi:MAG: hypothetical protein IKR68_06720 [Lachnospiraceae bacterium]|nr:hypothetical protein [Lachnospiraceae bacterium]
MTEIKNTIEGLINSIDEYLAILMQGDDAKSAGGMRKLTDAMSKAIPQIMGLYDGPLSQHAEDREYWPAQLGRILDALERKDHFLAADALNFEMKENLLLILKELD